MTEEKGAELAWMLNGLEMTEQTDTHRLGAWCLAPPPPERADMALRTRWAARTLGDAGRTNSRSAVTEVHCWSCKAPLMVTPETRGKKVKCPHCGTKQPLPR